MQTRLLARPLRRGRLQVARESRLTGPTVIDIRPKSTARHFARNEKNFGRTRHSKTLMVIQKRICSECSEERRRPAAMATRWSFIMSRGRQKANSSR